MGNSLLGFRRNYLSGGDYTVQGWLYFLACEVDEMTEKPEWLLDAQKHWHIEALFAISGGSLDANLDKYVTDEDRLQILLKIAQDTLQRLKSFGEPIKPELIKNLGTPPPIGNPSIEFVEPIAYFSDGNPVKFRQFGILFCELLRGTLHWAKARLMRGFGAYRCVYWIDYLETLIPDGMVGSGHIHLDEHGEEHIHTYSGAHWLSANNVDAHYTTYEADGVLKYGYCIGMPDLIIDFFPRTPWHHEKIEFDVHELYGLREHWYVDDETQTVAVRRLVDGKLVVTETVGVGGRFSSAVLGGKQIDVNRLLETE